MGPPAVGSVYKAPFPFSGEAEYKIRPVIVLATWSQKGTTDVLACMLTSQAPRDPYTVELEVSDYTWNPLNDKVIRSYVRPVYLFSFGASRLLEPVGQLTDGAMEKVKNQLKLALGF